MVSMGRIPQGMSLLEIPYVDLFIRNEPLKSPDGDVLLDVEQPSGYVSKGWRVAPRDTRVSASEIENLDHGELTYIGLTAIGPPGLDISPRATAVVMQGPFASEVPCVVEGEPQLWEDAGTLLYLRRAEG